MTDDDLRERMQRLLGGYYVPSTYPSTPRYVAPEVRLAVGAADAERTVRVPHPDCPNRRDRYALRRVHTTDPDRVRAAWNAVGQDAVDAILITSAEPAEPIGQRPVWKIDGFRDGIEGRAVRYLVRTREGTTIATKTRKGLAAALGRYEAACDEDWPTARILWNNGTIGWPDYRPVDMEVTNARASTDGVTLVGRRTSDLVRCERRVERAADGAWIDETWSDGCWGKGRLRHYEAWVRVQRDRETAERAPSAEDEEAFALLG